MTILIKRIYEPASTEDGKRILVDRLWPRGIKKEDAKIDLWTKEVTPSTELRKWYNHDPEKWVEFQQKYRAELKGNPMLLELKQMADKEVITFVYAAKLTTCCHALVLQQVVEEL